MENMNKNNEEKSDLEKSDAISSEFGEMKDIKLEHKSIFDSFFNKYQPDLSEMTFTNIFAWRFSRHFKFTVYQDHLIISAQKDDGKRVFYEPIGSSPEMIIFKMLSLHPNIVFERVSKKAASKVPSSLIVTPDRDNFDYVYSLPELKSLAGGKYMQKRNFVNRFKQYNAKVVKFEGVNVAECLALQQKWLDSKSRVHDKSLCDENSAIKETLNNSSSLGYSGICLYINGIMEGFVLGEKLSDSTFVDHFEKANDEFKGIHQVLVHEFALSIGDDIKFLNREQDIGVPGLRKSKESWNPVQMIEKFRITSK